MWGKPCRRLVFICLPRGLGRHCRGFLFPKTAGSVTSACLAKERPVFPRSPDRRSQKSRRLLHEHHGLHCILRRNRRRLIEHFTGPLPPYVVGALEMTQGVRRAAQMSAPTALQLAVQSGLMGFAGISVYFQVRSVTTTSDRPPTCAESCCKGGIAAALAGLAAGFLPQTAPVMAVAPVGGRAGWAASAVIVILYTFM